MKKLLVVTHSPSPYQVELFDAVAGKPDVELRVVYLYGSDPSRSWSKRLPQHDHLVLESNARQRELKTWEAEADLLVANYYRHAYATKVINDRARKGSPWVFWGERPGFSRPRLGRLARHWSLRALHLSGAPIWGIGDFAVAAYESEFGSKRQYSNIPYFSNLRRFAPTLGNIPSALAMRTVLYSGSLTPRKGVDLLAQAFARLAPFSPAWRLQLLGDGPLRGDLERVLAPVASQVTFAGFKDWDDLPSVYSGADILCVPSRYDGWGLVIPEGLASGLPVIATDRMGAAIDLVSDKENGWLVRADDGDALLTALAEAMAASRERLREMSCAALNSIARHSLQDGATRFVAASHAAIEAWSK
jgi:glycosyltransferase involved in cell wall biosynthesis